MTTNHAISNDKTASKVQILDSIEKSSSVQSVCPSCFEQSFGSVQTASLIFSKFLGITENSIYNIPFLINGPYQSA